jgi:hypothetical protein
MNRIHLINIALMVLSCLAAFTLPFELFLFAYAVLGPLHYLTEISWLHRKGYFTTGRRDAIGLLLLCVGVVTLSQAGGRGELTAATALLLTAFGAAMAMAFLHEPVFKIAGILAAALAGLFLGGDATARVLVLVFLPTIVHVCVFTAAFILLGALREKSITGLASVVVYGLCALSFFALPPGAEGAKPSTYVIESYTFFASVNIRMSEWFTASPIRSPAELFQSSTGVMLMRFIAFAYTYHYLNWFSKTSVIQWHKIPKSWAIANLVVWLASVALYAWDFRSGLLALAALSTLHVILEFPLNHLTFAGIASELGGLVGMRGDKAVVR